MVMEKGKWTKSGYRKHDAESCETFYVEFSDRILYCCGEFQKYLEIELVSTISGSMSQEDVVSHDVRFSG